jgi:uncharacterized Fe-S cluster protein YjdI
MSQDIVKKYTLNGVTVIWKPALCRYSAICARGLPAVFNPQRRPWIELQHADSTTVTEQVGRCPSGALSWTYVDGE